MYITNHKFHGQRLDINSAKEAKQKSCKLAIEWLREGTEHLVIFLFPPITQWCSISDVLFTGGRGVSDFSVLKHN